jgi:eukaryotic-like serine/threonine-protein kinase
VSRPDRARHRPPRPGWRRELPARVRRYFDERALLKWVLITGFACFVAGYLLMTLIFFPGFGRSAIVTVPDLAGRTVGSAGRALDRAGLDLLRGGALPNPRVRQGRVLMQTPLPGEEVARGTQVRIVVSAGPEMRQVPPVTGLSRNDAIGLLQRFGYRVAIQNVRDRREEGTLLGLRPAAGARAAVGTVVTMVISAGPPSVLVPSVIGLERGAAAARLEAGGLELGRVSYDPSSLEPAGSVVAQTPVAGDSLRMGSGVRVTLAGADPNPPPPPVDTLTAPMDTGLVELPADEEEPEEPEEPPKEGEKPGTGRE